MSWLKKRLPKKRWKRVCVYFVSTLLILLAADMILVQYWRRIEISPETTSITSRLNAAGFPDYLAAINQEYGKGVTLQNNAMPLLLKLTGTEDFPESLRAHSFPLIGLTQEPKASMLLTFSAWYEKSAPATQRSPGQKAGWEQMNDLQENPWTRADHPQAAAWIASQDAALQLAYEAIDRPRCFLPLREEGTDLGKIPQFLLHETLADIGPNYKGRLRDLARLLASDAMRSIGEGDRAGFQRDALAIINLARLAAQGPTLLESLNALAIDGLGSRTVKIGATHPGFFSAEQAKQMLNAIDSLPPLQSPAHAIDTAERWYGLNTLCFNSRSGGLFWPQHYNAALRYGNDFYDQLVVCYRLPTYRLQKAASERIQLEFRESWFGPSALVNPARLLVALSASGFDLIPQIWQQARTSDDLARLALALAAYRADHGSYPESLAALAPEYLKEIPTDGFIDAPLKYRTQGKGYLLYSVGPDETDDGGTDQAVAKGKSWDIVVRAGE